MNGVTTSQIKSDMDLCEKIANGMPTLKALEKELRRNRRLKPESKNAFKSFLNTSNGRKYASFMEVLRNLPDSSYHNIVRDFSRNDLDLETVKKMLALKKIIDRTK